MYIKTRPLHVRISHDTVQVTAPHCVKDTVGRKQLPNSSVKKVLRASAYSNSSKQKL